MGNTYFGSLGGNVHVSVAPTCCTVVAKRGSRLSLFKSMNRKKPLKASSRRRSSSTKLSTLSLSANETWAFSFIRWSRSLFTSAKARCEFGGDEKQFGRVNSRVGSHERRPYRMWKQVTAISFRHEKHLTHVAIRVHFQQTV